MEETNSPNIESLMTMVSELTIQVNVLTASLKESREVQDRTETDLAYDRGRIDNFILEMRGLKAEVQMLSERMPRLETKLTDAFSDALRRVIKPITEQMDNLMHVAKQQKIVKKVHKIGKLKRFWFWLMGKEVKQDD